MTIVSIRLNKTFFNKNLLKFSPAEWALNKIAKLLVGQLALFGHARHKIIGNILVSSSVRRSCSDTTFLMSLGVVNEK